MFLLKLQCTLFTTRKLFKTLKHFSFTERKEGRAKWGSNICLFLERFYCSCFKYWSFSNKVFLRIKSLKKKIMSTAMPRFVRPWRAPLIHLTAFLSEGSSTGCNPLVKAPQGLSDNDIIAVKPFCVLMHFNAQSTVYCRINSVWFATSWGLLYMRLSCNNIALRSLWPELFFQSIFETLPKIGSYRLHRSSISLLWRTVIKTLHLEKEKICWIN